MRASTNLKEHAINRSLRTNDSINEDYGGGGVVGRHKNLEATKPSNLYG